MPTEWYEVLKYKRISKTILHKEKRSKNKLFGETIEIKIDCKHMPKMLHSQMNENLVTS